MSKKTEDELAKEAQEQATLINNQAADIKLGKAVIVPKDHSPNEEHREEQRAGGGWRSNLARAGLAVAAVGALATSLAVKIITLDPLGLATDIISAVSMGAKAVGLDKAVAATGKELGKSSVLSTIGKGVRAVGIALTNQPFPTIVKAIGVAAALATAATPVGWGVAAIGAAALVANVAISSTKAGRTERFHHEAKKAEGLSSSKFEPKKGTDLAKFLDTKLHAIQNPELNKKNIAADVGRLCFLDSAAAVVTSMAIEGPVAAVAVGIGLLAATADAANEAINQKAEENEHRIARDKAMAKVICARLSQDLAEGKVKSEDFEAKYESYKKEEYAKNFPDSFPEKTGLKRVAQAVKDGARGFVPFISGGVTKLKNLFAKKEAPAQPGSQHPAQGQAQAKAQDKAQDKAAQIPTHIEVEADHSAPPPIPQGLDPQYMKEHTRVENEHGPHPGGGGGKGAALGKSGRI